MSGNLAGFWSRRIDDKNRIVYRIRKNKEKTTNILGKKENIWYNTHVGIRKQRKVMDMKKLPYGISDYERLIENDYYYVDKTIYIEKLENLAEPYILFLRPRKFGKTLFTSTLENYYDLKKENKFEELFGNTYIGKNPTKLKNKYHILKFNFSGIDTSDEETTIKGFKNEVASSIQVFVEKYGVDFYINYDAEAENILDNLIKAFSIQKAGEKIYVMIDEYDHFANELLGFHTNQFKELVSKNGKVRKWYEILKKGTESVVDRIFITGVAPITLDSLTSGFNIGTDITQDRDFNEMIGFTKAELIQMMDDIEISKAEQEEILPIMKENYDGYRFAVRAEEKIYNSNMCLYFLNRYIRFKEIPDQLVDMNIASDYSKLGKMLGLCQGEEREKIIEKTVAGEGIVGEITEKFNPAIEFTEKDLISMLFYLGYLTIEDEIAGYAKLNIPNKVMKEIYADYFLQVLRESTPINVEQNYSEIATEIALEGKIDKLVSLAQKYLENLSNRDYMKFDEKYVKLIFYCIAMNLKIFRLKSEMEVQRKYPDILLIPKNQTKGYKGVMIEFKYLKKEQTEKLQEKQEEARKQIEEYAELEEIKDIPNLNFYTIVAVNDEIYVEKI